MKQSGTLVISLDFELMWGMFDKVTIDSYGANLEGVHTAIPRTLELFETHGIHATWATVGMVLHSDFASLRQSADALSEKPTYQNPTLSAYRHLSTLDTTTNPKFYFAPALAKKIVATPHQEFASHTFAHYYCLEAQTGGEGKAFAADCIAFETAAKPFTERVTSIIFPRNQWSTAALETCAKRGYTAFRGTEDHFIYTARNESSKTNLILRALRLLDRYYNLTGHHTYKNIVVNNDIQVFNTPASRQLHPYSKKLSFLEGRKLKRIKSGMTHAAKRGEIFHLWWHPHNFGINQAKNFQLLNELLEHYRYLQTTYGMQSKNMQELSSEAT